jgi:hypothetical protein
MTNEEIKKIEETNPLIKKWKKEYCKYSNINRWDFIKENLAESFEKHFPEKCKKNK